jgi:hypothetical protein
MIPFSLSMVHFILCGFVVLSFCTCFASFLYCYTFLPMVSLRKNGEIRSLSGIMKAVDYKSYFCFVMGCLGGSLFLATGMRAMDEDSGFAREGVFVLSLGMFVCLIGVVNYDLSYCKVAHFTFVFTMITFGYIFCNTVLRQSGWGLVATLGYNLSSSFFLLCILNNVLLQSQGITDFRSVQSCFEIVWVLSLIFMLCVYSFEDVGP